MSEISNIYLVYCVRSKVPSNNLKKCPIPHHTVQYVIVCQCVINALKGLMTRVLMALLCMTQQNV